MSRPNYVMSPWRQQCAGRPASARAAPRISAEAMGRQPAHRDPQLDQVGRRNSRPQAGRILDRCAFGPREEAPAQSSRENRGKAVRRLRG